MSEEGEEKWEREMSRHIIYCSTSYMIIDDKKTEIKSYKTFLPQINTQCIANVLTYDDIDLHNKSNEIHQERSKASDENWSQIPMSFKYGHISAFNLYKEVNFFCQKSLNNALPMSV